MATVATAAISRFEMPKWALLFAARRFARRRDFTFLFDLLADLVGDLLISFLNGFGGANSLAIGVFRRTGASPFLQIFLLLVACTIIRHG